MICPRDHGTGRTEWMNWICGCHSRTGTFWVSLSNDREGGAERM